MSEFNINGMPPREIYQILTRLVVPRPIAFVSTLSADGVGNLAPFSFFTMGGLNPPSLAFCPANTRDGRVKDTVQNIEATGEYVVNLVTRHMAEAANEASRAFEPGVDEFDEVNCTRVQSSIVKPPRVAESPASMECRLFKILRHGKGALASNYIVGEVLAIHIDENFLEGGLPNTRAMDLVGRLGGDDYVRLSPEALFPLARPKED